MTLYPFSRSLAASVSALALAPAPALALPSGQAAPAQPSAIANPGLVTPSPRLSSRADGQLDFAVTDRPPGRYDDATQGYSLGRISRLPMLASGGSGNTAATCAINAPVAAPNARTALCHVVLSGGVATGFVVDDPGQGYVDASSVVVTVGNTGGTAIPAPYPVVEPATLWNYRGTLYQPVDLSAATAVWAPLNADTTQGSAMAPLPIDAATAAGAPAPVFAGGSMRLASAYAGGLFDVTRTSDSTVKTIPFLTTGIADKAALDGFVAGTGNYVSRLYNQAVAGNDATGAAATGAQYFGNAIGGIPALSLTSYLAAAAQSHVLTLSTSTSLTPGTMTVMILSRAKTSFKQDVALGMNGAASLFEYAHGSGAGLRSPGASSALPATVSPDVHAWVSNGSAATYADSALSGRGYVQTTPSGSYTDGTIGANLSTGLGGGQDIVAVLVWNAVLTVAQRQAVTQSLVQWGQIKPQVRTIIDADGDSIVEGVGATGNRHWVNQLMEATYPARWYNTAVGGQTMAFGIANFRAGIGQVYDPNAPNFVVLEEYGINDFLVNSSPASTVLSEAVNYGAMIKGLGGNVRLLFQTLPGPCAASNPSFSGCPKITTAQDAQRAAYNPLLRAAASVPQASGGVGADVVVDMGVQALTAPAASPLVGSILYNSALFTPDGLHPDGAGGAAYVAPYQDAIKRVLQ